MEILALDSNREAGIVLLDHFPTDVTFYDPSKISKVKIKDDYTLFMSHLIIYLTFTEEDSIVWRVATTKD